MQDNNKTHSSSIDGSSKTLVITASIGIAALTLYLFVIGQDIIIPLILAILITYLLTAFANTLQKVRVFGHALPSNIALACSFIILAVAISILVQLVAGNLNAIVDAAPEYQKNLQLNSKNTITKIETWLGAKITIANLTESINIQKLVISIAGALRDIAASTFQIFLYVIFLILETRMLGVKIKAFASSKEQEQIIISTLKTIGHNIEVYVLIKTTMSILVAAMSYGVLSLANIDFAAFWALLIFILNYIPFIGSVTAVTFPCVFSVLQYSSVTVTVGVLIGLLGAQILVGNLIEPKLTGKSLNLSPVVIILALSIWGSIWGIIGMILSVPIMVITMIILSQFKPTRPFAILMSQNGEIQ